MKHPQLIKTIYGTDDPFHIEFSPDGKYLAYVERGGFTGKLIIHETVNDFRKVSQIFVLHRILPDIAWSPDGSMISDGNVLWKITEPTPTTPRQPITGPWLWMIAPTEVNMGGAASTDVDSLAMVSGGTTTETDIATNGANEGDVVGNYAWAISEIRHTGIDNTYEIDNVTDVINGIGWANGKVRDHSSYALINLHSTTTQNNVNMNVGSDNSIKVWLNGEVVFKNPINRGSNGFQDSFQVNIKQGDNLLLVKVSQGDGYWTMFVSIDADVTYEIPTTKDPNLEEIPHTDATVSIIPLPVESPAVGELFTVSLTLTDGEDIAGYQATIQYDTTALRFVSTEDGDFLPSGSFSIPRKLVEVLFLLHRHQVREVLTVMALSLL
ncbi:MAG: cohesin domain-containing protein [Candidatus Poribacteria bacterium]|nr:cohesin domain-containing protein [Candidatus Poribacteria bacterium]